LNVKLTLRKVSIIAWVYRSSSRPVGWIFVGLGSSTFTRSEGFRFPELKVLNLQGLLKHPAAFETTSRPAPRRFFDKGLPIDGFYFLRISFEFVPKDITPESTQNVPENSETLKVDVPKFIS